MAIQPHDEAVRADLANSTQARLKRKSPKERATPSSTTPQSLVASLRERYSTRFHMFLIIASCVAIAVLATRALLYIGVTTMWVRYAAALGLAYGTFFTGVWVWLHLSRYGRHLRAD